jgi:cobalt-precorrin 5A hydrolase
MTQDFPMVIAPHQHKVFADARMAVWVLTPNGKRLGETLCGYVKQARLFISARLADDIHHTEFEADSINARTKNVSSNVQVFHRLSDAVAEQFHQYDCHLFIFSTGIAVRILAPLLISKLTDPAVVVMDDKGLHAISLVSGHVGQANAYTRQIAQMLGADPVITTATDVNNLPAIDLLAEQMNLFIETPRAIKTINMAFLQNQKIRLQDPLNLISPWLSKHWIDHTSDKGPLIVCDWVQKKVSRETLVLRPRVLAVGIGCNRNTSFTTIFEFLTNTLASAGISIHCAAVLATVDIKHNEPGILSLSEHLNIPVKFYDTHQLSSVKAIQTPSKMVEKHVGVKSVCEAAAILASNTGPLILPKQKNQDVTLAVALQKTNSLWWEPDRDM